MLFAIAVFAPLFGAVVAGLFGKLIGDRAAEAVTILCMGIAALCGVGAFVGLVYGGGSPGVVMLGSWIEAGSLHLSWALHYDGLSAVMVAMVTVVGLLIHIYSVGYMAHDDTPWRFFAYLNLFCFTMLMLVTADNLVQLFFGWEGVGLASYLLIGYWYQRESACNAAMKAFIVNRIGDLGFALGIALVFWTTGSVEFGAVFPAIAEHQNDLYHLFGTEWPAMEVIGFLLFIGAMGKSAQLGLHVWLPDAMEGPTPVSALIHAATMVTAGVFLMARFSPVMEVAPHALAFVTFIGATTALFAATIGCVQNDIKRVIAYSTCSQLGYMFVAAGVGAYQVSMFHLLTHAFFKALLFLSAGSVIHAMADEQDMRRMGGLWKKIPLTYAMFWVGSLALAGVPPFAGYYSKDAILEAAYAAGTGIGAYGFWCGLIAAFLTAFYSWRLILMTFHGKPRMDAETFRHAHESPPVMTVPLLALAVGAVVVGFSFRDQLIGAHWASFWGSAIVVGGSNHVLAAMEEVPGWVSAAPTLLGLVGIGLACLLYAVAPGIPGRLAAQFRPLYLLLLNKYYVDEIYAAIFVRPFCALARVLWQLVDATLIDGVPNGIAALAQDGSGRSSKLQTGSLAVYAFAMLIGVVVLSGLVLLAVVVG
jgi:NADH-quinone oxidoreductase subunit L